MDEVDNSGTKKDSDDLIQEVRESLDQLTTTVTTEIKGQSELIQHSTNQVLDALEEYKPKES